jgi:hypothetical protein
LAVATAPAAPRQNHSSIAGMAHEVAKLMLEHAATFLQRTEAIDAALRLGMPLAEIEDYLDWLDATRGSQPAPAEENRDPPANSP